MKPNIPAAPAVQSSIPRPVEDRRRHPRYMLTLAITLRGDNNFYVGLTEDISEGGVFISTHHVLPIGTPVVLSFTLMRSLEPIVARGTVRWLRGPEATAWSSNVFGGELPGVKPGMGIQFDELSDDAARLIRMFMQRRRPELFD